MTGKHRHDSVTIDERARPVIVEHAKEVQHFGSIARLPIALDAAVCAASVEVLNQLLADTMTLRDMYKKHHWQVGGPTFYQLHLLFDKHYEAQSELVDLIAERIQSLGGVSIAMAYDVAEMTLIPRPPRGREEVPVEISRRWASTKRPCSPRRRVSGSASIDWKAFRAASWSPPNWAAWARSRTVSGS